MSVASQVPNFFSTWCKSFARDIGFKWRLDLERPLLGAEHEEKEMPTFSSSFGEEALLLDGFLRDIDSRNHAINPSRFAKKSDLQTPAFMVHYGRHGKQTNRKTIKRTWNLQDTTYPFGDKYFLTKVYESSTAYVTRWKVKKITTFTRLAALEIGFAIDLEVYRKRQKHKFPGSPPPNIMCRSALQPGVTFTRKWPNYFNGFQPAYFIWLSLQWKSTQGWDRKGFIIEHVVIWFLMPETALHYHWASHSRTWARCQSHLHLCTVKIAQPTTTHDVQTQEWWHDTAQKRAHTRPERFAVRKCTLHDFAQHTVHFPVVYSVQCTLPCSVQCTVYTSL